MTKEEQFINSHPLDDYIDQQQLNTNTTNNPNLSQNTIAEDFERQFNENELKKLILLANKLNH